MLRHSVLSYEEHPAPDEIRLIVEISDTTAALDLRRKAALYARAGIVEYWVPEVAARQLVVFRKPSG